MKSNLPEANVGAQRASAGTPNHGAGSVIEHSPGSIFFNVIERKMNHVNLIGKMTTAPRFYELPNGRKIAQFTMSTRETYLDEDGKSKDKNHRHRMSAWGRWVPVLEEFSLVGKDIAVEGKLTTRFYLKGGEKRFISEVEVNDLIIL